FFFSSRRRHTRCLSDWSSDVCSSDLYPAEEIVAQYAKQRLDPPPFRILRHDFLCRIVLRREQRRDHVQPRFAVAPADPRADDPRSEERRVGKGWRLRWCRSPW